ncbi:unnamed protein product [Adineta steineri]|uniref:SHSP domain-containing protein n=1 Tax=Adineta steineri TaxID=433720 RepID=A0A814EV56_9BILA|nr:unnamed protein product [Adineta steineri]CAF3615757.1 unnamed protein product [Adineta steineri]
MAMSSLPIHRYPRPSKDNKFDSDTFGDDFEWFDPWKDTNSNTPGSLRWINQPKQQQQSVEEKVAPALQSPIYGDKYRVKLDISDFDPETIQTKLEGRLLIIEAKKKHHHHQSNSENVIERILYDLPEPVYEHADAEHLVSYVTLSNTLIVEIPLHNHEHKQRYLQSTSTNTNDNTDLLPYGQHRDQSFDYHHFHTSAFTPKVLDAEGQKKKLQMSLPMKNYHPEQIKVSVKNNDLIIQGKHISPGDRSLEKSYFYKSITLPPGTQIDHLQSYLTQDGHLQIEAPFTEYLPKN